LVLHKHGELLFQGVKDAVTDHLDDVAKKVSQTPDDQLLAEISERWTEHKVTMVMIRDILMYMDRTYVVQQKRTVCFILKCARKLFGFWVSMC
jgi:cullin 3